MYKFFSSFSLKMALIAEISLIYDNPHDESSIMMNLEAINIHHRNKKLINHQVKWIDSIFIWKIYRYWEVTPCRPFIVQRVSGSNMILLVINNLCRANHDETIPWPEPTQYNYNMSTTCYKVLYNNLPRRHYMSCINRNINVSIDIPT